MIGADQLFHQFSGMAKKIVEASGEMRVETIAIGELSFDPANVRLHPTKNLEAIKASLRRFGQQKPIVVDASGVIRAGNGTYAAAKALGWKQLAIVRSDLPAVELTAFAIADNRTGELAEWDDDLLAQQLGSLAEDGFDLSDVGFDEKDMKKMLGEEDENSAGETLGDGKFMIVVTCRDEQQQVELLERFADEEIECKALVG